MDLNNIHLTSHPKCLVLNIFKIMYLKQDKASQGSKLKHIKYKNSITPPSFILARQFVILEAFFHFKMISINTVLEST